MIFKKKNLNTDSANTPHQAVNGVSVSLADLITLRHLANSRTQQTNSLSYTNLTGTQVSCWRGRGIDFAEVRAYQWGDDVRHIDWRVTARTGETHTKLFHEERERSVFIIVDYSPSMFFGTRVAFKSVVAAKAAAIIAWHTISHQERMGAFIFCGHHCESFPLQANPRAILPFLQALAYKTTPRTTTISRGGLIACLRQVSRVARPGSMIFVLSDFMDLPKTTSTLFTQLSAHHDINLLRISDPLEHKLPISGQYPLTDGQRFITIDMNNSSLQQRYQQFATYQRAQLARIVAQSSISLLDLSTAEENLNLLLQFLATQRRSLPTSAVSS